MSTSIIDLEMIVLDDGVGEELVAHRLQRRFSAGFVALGKLDVEDLALADAAHAGEAERGERALDRLALRIEDARFEGDGDARLHQGGATGPAPVPCPSAAPAR